MNGIPENVINKAKEVAKTWQGKVHASKEKEEKEFDTLMKAMLGDELNKIFMIELLDQSFRSHNPKRVADQLEYIFKKYEKTDFFNRFEQTLIWLFRHVGTHMPNFSVPLFIKQIRDEISTVVIKGEAEQLQKHIKMRYEEGTEVILNVIGEAVLGEQEAQKRLDKYVDILENSGVTMISIKISTIYSQINVLDFENSVNEISKRLSRIYQAAMKSDTHKLVYLDMEEYKDMDLTLEAFMQTLSQEAFRDLKAGIVMQAYVPDTLEKVKRLHAWAKERVESGGSCVQIRLVKGANQQMELTESSLRGWPCVVFGNEAPSTKRYSDANFKLVMDYVMDKEVAPYVNIGLGSHNLFDQALGYLLSKERGVQEYCHAEMLEGMCEAAYHTMKAEGIRVHLYAPTATAQTFTNAVAYLVRRFDENTAANNFMRHSFGLQVDTLQWEALEKTYDDAIATLKEVPTAPFRTQNRNEEVGELDVDVENYIFKNESDTDFILKQNREWAKKIRDKWKTIGQNGGYDAALVIGGEVQTSDEAVEVFDKSQYHEGVKVGRWYRASAEQLKKAVDAAKEDRDGWRTLSSSERQKILMQAAHEIRKMRGDLIGIAAAEVGKVFTETDVEVSEAIDFCNFYPYAFKSLEKLEGVSLSPKGVGLVVSPWNFPVAIPCGGIIATLSSGNCCIVKPASASVLSAYMVCECLWRAGVSKNTLQFVPTGGELAGKVLIDDERIDFVILTGGESTAFAMLKQRPTLYLSAETGGKDATIVTAMADRDQAVKNVLHSAFNNSGQKCSATSLLVLEKEVYEDKEFQTMLTDAAASLEVGSVWEFKNRLGALVDKPGGKLEHALGYLDRGERWALEPSYAQDNNPYMLKPSIRWGTKLGDYCHMNELFGPVLSVMCAAKLEEAVEMVNATGYGLTSGIESLDEREIEYWKGAVKAGNLYVNRPTTGAIVLRQPFGGMGKSAVGAGKKAGGPNYVMNFVTVACDTVNTKEQSQHPLCAHLLENIENSSAYSEKCREVAEIIRHFIYWVEREFGIEHDYVNIRGESNVFRYVPCERVLFRFGGEDDFVEMLSSCYAAKLANAQVCISIPEHASSPALLWLAAHQNIYMGDNDRFVMQSDEAFAESMTAYDRVRMLNALLISSEVYTIAAEHAVYLAKDPFVRHGRIEMTHYYKEQSVSHSYHRYGNLGIKGIEADR